MLPFSTSTGLNCSNSSAGYFAKGDIVVPDGFCVGGAIAAVVAP